MTPRAPAEEDMLVSVVRGHSSPRTLIPSVALGD